MEGSLLSDRAVPVKGLSHEMDLSLRKTEKVYFSRRVRVCIPDSETVAPPRGKKLSARVGTQAATCTVAKPTTAVAAAAAGRDPAAAAAAATTTGTTQAATTAPAISDREERNMTAHRKLITMVFGVTQEGGVSKDAVPTAAAAVYATEDRH